MADARETTSPLTVWAGRTMRSDLGLLAWGGLYLRDARLRALIPLRRRDAGGPEAP
ncbi:hypothetical protein [Methylobacterium sp. sgz302541]|uniref:hypothetical protein n=1 Tax=unclassified Methylobacterium TaxID=2615210 RepID=UPI003D332802